MAHTTLRALSAQIPTSPLNGSHYSEGLEYTNTHLILERLTLLWGPWGDTNTHLTLERLTLLWGHWVHKYPPHSWMAHTTLRALSTQIPTSPLNGSHYSEDLLETQIPTSSLKGSHYSEGLECTNTHLILEWLTLLWGHWVHKYPPHHWMAHTTVRTMRHRYLFRSWNVYTTMRTLRRHN